MATTTNYSWTTPDDTALVKDGAAAIRTLGSSVDTTVKALNPGTTSGDLDYYTSSTTKVRIPKGTAGQVFTMNSGATAPEWQTSSAEKSRLVSKNTSTYLKRITTSSANLTATTSRTYYIPMYLPNYALNQIAFRTGSALWTGTGTYRLGIYNCDSNGQPSTVYLDAGTVNATADGTTYTITISTTPTSGYYFLAFNQQTAPTGGNILAQTLDTSVDGILLPSMTTVQATTYQNHYFQAGVTGAFATATSLSIGTGDTPLVAVRVA